MNPAYLMAAAEPLPMNEALMDAGIVILVVFAVLCIICLLITISGKIFASLDKNKKPAKAAAPETKVVAAEPVSEEDFSSGTLKLKGCDETTAAMIMSIVSDNTGIPLSELVFKSITLVEKN